MAAEQMQRCFKCGIEKPLDEFYKHPQTGNGHLGKCKECTKKDVRQNHAKRREQYSAYDAARLQLPERRANQREYFRRSRQQHPEKSKAYHAVMRALRKGTLVKQPCKYCGDPNSQAHHPDYSKPLDVVWVCFKHHREMEHGQVVLRVPRKESLSHDTNSANVG